MAELLCPLSSLRAVIGSTSIYNLTSQTVSSSGGKGDCFYGP